jgi:small subunit ribosomal protein S16
MPVKIRLQRKGRKKRPFYHIVIADSRAPRDGRFIEQIGSYNPLTKPATIEVDRDKAYDWLMKGAQPTDTVRAILRFKGVYYRKHLMRGVKKGALTQEEADKKYQEWIEAKEAKIAERFEQSRKEQEEFTAQVAGAHIAAPKAEEKPAGLDEEATETTEAETSEEASIEDTQAEAVIAQETSDTNSEMVEKTPEEVEETAEAAAQEETPEEEQKEEEPVAEEASEENKEG